MKTRWVNCPPVDEQQQNALSRSINVSMTLARILLLRNVANYEQAERFFRPTAAHLLDPFLMKGMDTAIQRIKQAIDKEEKILIFGDYDVDGTTAIALVYDYFQKKHPNIDFYLPDRYTEGYGLSSQGIDWARRKGFSLIIALDIGIKANDAVQQAKDLGIDCIICDHHLPGDELPSAVAILNPKQQGCPYSYKELSGCGIGFKLIQAYEQRYSSDLDVDQKEKNIMPYVDLVAVSACADIVDITGENRTLTRLGLKQLYENPRPGLRALAEVALMHAHGSVSTEDVLFKLGPRINAAGRMGHGRTAVELLLCRDKAKAMEKAKALNEKNDTRRALDISTTEEAFKNIDAICREATPASFVLFNPEWSKGIVGIVAARCVEKYYRPTVILTQSENEIVGSARGIKDLDLYEALSECRSLLKKFGGHRHAAGLTLTANNLPSFRQAFEEAIKKQIAQQTALGVVDILQPAIEINAEICFDQITPNMLNILRQMSPYGPQNMKPIFCARKVIPKDIPILLKEKHISFVARQENNKNEFRAIGFNLSNQYKTLSADRSFDIAFTIEDNFCHGRIVTQLNIKDIKPIDHAATSGRIS